MAAGQRGGGRLGAIAVRLADFEVLSFDCYGTLIDWESGIYDALAPLRARAGGGEACAGMGLSRNAVLQAFARLESRQQEKAPVMPYPDPPPKPA